MSSENELLTENFMASVRIAELQAQNEELRNLVNEGIELVCMSDTKRGTIDNRIKKMAWLKAAKQGKENE